MKWTAKKRLQSVVGLTLADGHLEACHQVREKGAIATVKAASAAMTIDLMHPEPELVGREIRNHLDAAGIRERRCIIGLPSTWVMSQHGPVPGLSPEDELSFLEIEAERAFPCDLSQLQIVRSSMKNGDNKYVTQLAVRKEQLEQLSTVAKAAGLKPVGYSIGLAAIPEVISAAGNGRITAVLQPRGATVLVWAGGGIAAFRTFESSIESEGNENVLNAAAVMRELRVTLEQLPSDLRNDVRALQLFGDAGLVRSILGRASEWARGAGLVLVEPKRGMLEIGPELARSLAVQALDSGTAPLNFLAQRPGRWTALAARYSSRRTAATGFVLGAVGLIALLAFGWQAYRRMSLRSDWNGMKTEVAALQSVQNRISEYRPWYDANFRNLTILRRITETFPDNGSVTARTIEIKATAANAERDGVVVHVTGTTRDNAALLRTHEQLLKLREVGDLKVEQIRGKSPAQFTFTFRWKANSGS